MDALYEFTKPFGNQSQLDRLATMQLFSRAVGRLKANAITQAELVVKLDAIREAVHQGRVRDMDFAEMQAKKG